MYVLYDTKKGFLFGNSFSCSFVGCHELIESFGELELKRFENEKSAEWYLVDFNGSRIPNRKLIEEKLVQEF